MNLSTLTLGLRPRARRNPRYAFLLHPDDTGEVVSVHCAASTYDRSEATLQSLSAVRIRGTRILTSQRLSLDFPPHRDADPLIDQFLRFIGSRPLVGYYLDFTLAVLNRYVRHLAGMDLPNPQVEVSSLYYDQKRKAVHRGVVDLRLDAVLMDLDLPPRSVATPDNDALAAALIYLKMQALTRN